MICNAAFLLLKCKHARSWIFPPCKYINDSSCNYSIDTHQCSHISTFSTIFLYQTRPSCISATQQLLPIGLMSANSLKPFKAISKQFGPLQYPCAPFHPPCSGYVLYIYAMHYKHSAMYKYYIINVEVPVLLQRSNSRHAVVVTHTELCKM